MSLDQILAGTPVKTIMTAAVETAVLGTPLRQALEQMVNANVGSLVVITSAASPLFLAHVVGLAPVYFALRKLLQGETGVSIEDAMFTDYIVARQDEAVGDVMERIVNNKTWRMIVTGDDDRVVGLLSATDIMRLLVQSAPPGKKA